MGSNDFGGEIIGVLKHGVRNRVRVMVFNANFNNFSTILWRSVLLLEETGVPGENHRSAASH
jgi:hypothetical protein